jgi:hypothetical protein
MSADSAGDLNVPIITLRDAEMGQASAQAGVNAAKVLAPIDLQPESADTARRGVQRAVARVLEPWRLMHGDTSQTRRTIARLRLLTRNSRPDEQVYADLEIAFIEMLHADVTRSPGLRHSVEKLDSLMTQLDVAAAVSSRLEQQAVAGARIWEKLGEPARALTTIGRYGVWNTESIPYFSVQLREQARIASLAGDKWRAIRARRHFIAMRSAGEPSTRRETDAVARELTQLESSR